MPPADIVVVGAGAAGLMAAIQAARAAPHLQVVALDGAHRLGAKILISGGGRCNVTHRVVQADDFHGSTRPAIRKVLARYDVAATTAFFAALGVPLREEPSGKLFPVSNRAASVLDALTTAARDAGVTLRHPYRVERIEPHEGAFVVRAAGHDALTARRVVLATGGRSVPKTGSDGRGYEMVRALGVPLTPRLFPALVPLTLPDGHWLRGLSGLSAPVRLTVRAGSGRRLRQVDGALLATHLGMSGPAVLDVSRHWQDACVADPEATLSVDWLPAATPDDTDAMLLALHGRVVAPALSATLPERLARAVLAHAGIPPDATGATLTREARRQLVRTLHEGLLPVTGTRGFAVAEVTAGGVPLSALHLDRLETRACPGLHLCGEICDVDGRLGGFNFQWAWASGMVAGVGAATGLTAVPPGQLVSG